VDGITTPVGNHDGAVAGIMIVPHVVMTSFDEIMYSVDV
jgi:hypothetical protein